MIVHYLTWLKNKIGKDHEIIDLEEDISTISEMLDYLETKGIHYKNTLSNRNVIYCEIRGQIVPHETPISNINEIKLFSPIVGG